MRPITLADLLATEFAERQDVVAPWLRQGESALLWSATGLGKTMLALSLALAVAGGGKLLGWSSPTPRKVVYVDGEMHIQDLRDRLVLLAGTVEGCDPKAAGQNLTLICRQHQAATVQFPDIASRAGQDAVLAAAVAAGAELVILDNLSTLADLADENDAGAVAPVLHFLLRLKQAGIACILVHHSNKGGEAFRGSSKLGTTFEVIIGLVKLDGRQTTEGTGFELRWEKLRNKPDPATRPMAATLEDIEGQPQWRSAGAPGMEMDMLMEAVQSGLYATGRAIAAALGWDAAKVSRMRNQAVSKGRITDAAWKSCLASCVAERGANESVERPF